MPFDIRHLMVYLCAALLAVAPGLAWVSDADECRKWVEVGNFENAYPMCKLAAMQRNVEAQYNLGVMYYLGVGVNEDPQEAYTWLLLAASGENKEAHGLKETVGKNLSLDQILAAVEDAESQAFASSLSLHIIIIHVLIFAAITLISLFFYAIIIKKASKRKGNFSVFLRKFTTQRIIFDATMCIIWIFFSVYALHLIGWRPTTDSFFQFLSAFVIPIAIIVAISMLMVVVIRFKSVHDFLTSTTSPKIKNRQIGNLAYLKESVRLSELAISERLALIQLCERKALIIATSAAAIIGFIITKESSGGLADWFGLVSTFFCIVSVFFAICALEQIDLGCAGEHPKKLVNYYRDIPVPHVPEHDRERIKHEKELCCLYMRILKRYERQLFTMAEAEKVKTSRLNLATYSVLLAFTTAVVWLVSNS